MTPGPAAVTGEDQTLSTGITLTCFLVVSDQDRSRDWWCEVFGAQVVQRRDPVLLAVWDTVIILNVPGARHRGVPPRDRGPWRDVAHGADRPRARDPRLHR